MTLVSLKIWRAFHELDEYDDEVCRLYIKHARRLSNTWRGALLVLLTIAIAVVSWSIVIYFAFDPIVNHASSARGNAAVAFGLLLVAILLTGIIWFPLLCAFVTRDRWLRRCVVKQLHSTNCAGCGYQLVGLTIVEKQGSKHVLCPECGTPTELNTGSLREADINPEMLRLPITR